MSSSCCPSSPRPEQPQKTETEDCCEYHPPQKCGPAECPQCQALGKTVKRITPGALVKPERRPDIPLQDEFCFCRNPQCDVVYFQPEKVIFRKGDLNVKVGIKEPNDPTAPVCYCFGWTPQKIQAEIRATERSTAVEQIKAQVKASNCYCEVTNPQGSCCLGNVTNAVKQAMALSREDKR